MQRIMRKLWHLVALALVLTVGLAAVGLAAPKQSEPAPLPIKVTVLTTANMQGQILDWDYNRSQKSDIGLAKVYSLVKKIRQSDPHTILLDSGNMLTGTPLTDYYSKEAHTNPMIEMYNYIGYDAMVLGEKELSYGSTYLIKTLTGAKFPVLSANISGNKELASAVRPYIIKEIEVGKDKKKEKIRIGLIGVTEDYAGLQMKDQSETVQAISKQISNKVDAIIVITNAGIAINGVTAAVPGKSGSYLNKTELTFEKIKGKWQLNQTETTSLSTILVPADRALSDLAWPYHDTALQYLKQANDKEKATKQP